jgi:hypothetical protein
VLEKQVIKPCRGNASKKINYIYSHFRVSAGISSGKNLFSVLMSGSAASWSVPLLDTTGGPADGLIPRQVLTVHGASA